MAQGINRRVVLAARPVGAPKPSDFALDEAPIPEPGPGELLCRTLYLSLDPYMRGRMSAAKSYAKPVDIGAVMEGGTVSEVVRSHNPAFAPGDIVEGRTGWQAYGLSDGTKLRKVDPALAPITTALGVLGMPGLTAYVGLSYLGQPKIGETVVVAAASGPVGGTVGQLARLAGCRAVGIAGGPEKCAFVRDSLGFDACVDHRAPDFAEALAKSCPDGIDVYFESVAGHVLRAVLPLLNPFSRVPVCGVIAHYNETEPPPGPDHLPALIRATLVKRITWRGFLVFDFADKEGEFLAHVGPLVRDGRIRYREDRVDGLENAPAALIGLLEGRNFGKVIVRVGAEPGR